MVKTVRRLGSALVGWWSESPWIDYILSTVILGLHVYLIRYHRHGDILTWISKEQRLAVYGTGATVISVLGGLSAIAATVYMAASGERAQKVRLHFHNALRRNWTYLLLNVGLSAALCLLAQVLDNASDTLSIRFLFEYAIIVGAFSFMRLVWLFDAIMAVSDLDIAAPGLLQAPKLNPIWQSKLSRKP
ncbi:hypothetical protein ACOZ38_32855 [Sphaerisporangium viridialbum]|uniref:hypothetical protein n=1 Tax=Sphaerisporangium viridialbum TaxID=46189 RepID=UPI003C712B75